MANDYDLLFKLILLGDSAVGKSNLLSRITKNTFNGDTNYTICFEFPSRSVTIDSKIIKTQIWDTAGQERFRSLSPAYYRRAAGALFVYDISRRESFDSIEMWLRQLRDYGESDAALMLVGNKTDLKDLRAVSTEEAQAFASQNKMVFTETSALDTTNVETAFQTILAEMYQIACTKPPEDHGNGQCTISFRNKLEATEARKGGRCC